MPEYMVYSSLGGYGKKAAGFLRKPTVFLQISVKPSTVGLQKFSWAAYDAGKPTFSELCEKIILDNLYYRADGGPGQVCIK